VPSKPGLVIFDCDGVLVDSEVISNRALARNLTAVGLETTLAEARREYQGLLLREVIARAEGKLGRALPDGWLARFEQERREEFRRELRPVDGAIELLNRVQAAAIPVCVASQGSQEKTRHSLALTGLDRLLPGDAVFSAHEVPRGKPHPDLFLHAAATLGVVPARCVVLEDTPTGVTAAVAAGMRVLGYAADSDERALREAGAEVVLSLQDVPAALGLERGRCEGGEGRG